MSASASRWVCRPTWRRRRYARAGKWSGASCSRASYRKGRAVDADGTASRQLTEHLRASRTLIVTRALPAAAAGVVPVPVLDDALAAFVRAHLLRTIADRRQVDMTREALIVLSDEPQMSRLSHMTMTGLTLLALRKAWRKLFLLLAITRRGSEFAHCFELGTLFDHYCARHHVGAAVDTEAALKLRNTVDAVRKRTRRDALFAAFRRATGRRALVLAGEPSAETLAEKASRVFSEEMDGGGAGYVESLVAAFDGTWIRPK